MVCLKSERDTDGLTSFRNIRKIDNTDKMDEIDEITQYMKGNICRSKTNHQIVSELIKKNAIIHKQIDGFLLQTSALNNIDSNIQL